MVLRRCLGEAMTVMSGLEEEKIFEDALKKYVEERRWRAFVPISGAYIIGIVQQGFGGFMMRILQNKFLSRKLSKNSLKQENFDCRTLSSCTPF